MSSSNAAENGMQTLATLFGPELAGVASIWAAQHRELTVSFGGTSMLPTIAPGQKVRLRCGVMPGVGEVVVFRWANQLAVHRVVACRDEGAWHLTWGDANPLPDEPVDDRLRIVGTLSAAECDGEMRPIRPFTHSFLRRLILRLAAPRNASTASVARRVALLYRVRANLALGPAAILRKLMRKLGLRGMD